MGTSVRDASLDVTVVTPAHNRAHLISRALNSVRTQKRSPHEVIVIDDASTDDTAAVATRWAAEHAFPVRVEKLRVNGGPAVARNRGIALATTRYVAFLDSDDEHLPDTLSRLVAPLQMCPDAVVSFADATVVTGALAEPHALFAPHIDLTRDAEALPEHTGGVFRLRNARDAMLKASIIPTSATCFRRDAAIAVGGLPESLRSGEDWVFWLRLAGRGAFVFQLDDLALHHRHDENLTRLDGAEFEAREKLRALAALLEGTLGVDLDGEQRRKLTAMVHEQVRSWRYHLSRLGLSEYLGGLQRQAMLPVIGTRLRQCVADPKSLLRAILFSMR